jgi:phosphatidylglycerophosphate synthase
VPSFRTGPVAGLVITLFLLAALSSVTTLGVAGWVAGAGYAAGLCVLLSRAMDRAGLARFGPADWVTLTRACLVGCVTALTAQSVAAPGVPVGMLVGITVVALVLDAVDGRVARGTGTASALGARFDMEVDAFLILVLSVLLVRPFGVWVLAIGGMRYAYVAASWVLPWLRGSLFPRYWRKVVAAIQGIVQVTAVSAVLARPVALVALVVALGLLTESFGRDVVYLWRRASAGPQLEAAPAPQAGIYRTSDLSRQ